MAPTGDRATDNETPSTLARERWYALLRVAGVALTVFVVWFVIGHWNGWVGGARFQTSNDAFVAGDVTPLAAKISGYIRAVNVTDFQSVHRGDVIVEIDNADYAATVAQAEASLSAAEAELANLANQKAVQQSLVRQAASMILATKADLVRYTLEEKRQRDLVRTSIAGTPQGVEQATANAEKTAALVSLNEAQLDQQKAVLTSLDVQEKQLEARVRGAAAQLALAKNNLGYTKIVSPADGIVGLRQVRPGQFVNVGTQVLSVVSLPGVWVISNLKETQMGRVRIGQSAQITVDAYPTLSLTGHVDSWAPGTGSTFALLPPDNATGNFTKVVQRVPVKIVIDARGEEALVPGMSVVATIDTVSLPDDRIGTGGAPPTHSAQPK